MLKVQRPSDGSKWLVLELIEASRDCTPLGEERFDRPFKQIWYMVRSYLVHKADASKLIGSLAGESFWGRWMPESTDEYKILQGEYFGLRLMPQTTRPIAVTMRGPKETQAGAWQKRFA